jgi:Holliday junction resolvase-like predicted endonuclease
LSHSSSDFKPEEAVHPWKQKKFARIIEAYLLASNWEGEWRIDIASVRVHLPSKQARIKVISDVVLG